MKSRDEPDPLAVAKVYVAYGRYEQAAELLERAATADPTRAELQELLVQVRAKGKSWSPAQSWTELCCSIFVGIGFMLVFSFEAWSIESLLGWCCVGGSAVFILGRVLYRRKRCRTGQTGRAG